MSAFLDEATAIANEMVEQAIWTQARCNWVYAHKEVGGAGGGMARALDPTIHTGTAGVALFLARLHEYSGERRHAVTAQAALRHALRNAWFVDPRDDPSALKTGGRWRYGFYLGTLGIAWAAHEVGRLTHEQGLVRDAGRLVRALVAQKAALQETDIMFGAAGGVCATLDMAAAGVDGAAELEQRLAKGLLGMAHVDGDNWSWGPYPTNPEARNMTGFSHGAAGVAYALTRHYEATGDERFRRAALGAFSYERSLYMEHENNWPDYSKPADAEGHRHGRLTWCHGAPGIALSRALTIGVLKDELLVDDMEKGHATARRQLDWLATRPQETFMLCCGVGGVTECVQHAASALGRASAWDDARALGRIAIARYGRDARREAPGWIHWPTGALKGAHPALIQGTSGIGAWLLRLHRPAENPSVLVPAASAWRARTGGA